MSSKKRKKMNVQFNAELIKLAALMRNGLRKEYAVGDFINNIFYVFGQRAEMLKNVPGNHDHAERGITRAAAEALSLRLRIAVSGTIPLCGLIASSAVAQSLDLPAKPPALSAESGTAYPTLPNFQPNNRPGNSCAVAEMVHTSVLLEKGEQEIRALFVDMGPNGIAADGVSKIQVQLKALGMDGQPLVGEQSVRVITNGISYQTNSWSEQTPGTDRSLRITLVDGKADLTLMAPSVPGSASIVVSGGGQRVSTCINFVPALRDMLVVGMVDGVIGFSRGLGLAMQPAQSEDGFDQAISSFSRTSADGTRHAALRSALFLRGKIKGDALLTLAYDSDKNDTTRMFGDIRPEAYYPVYGDGSLQGNDALSNARLYVRIDKGRNHVLFGDLRIGDGAAILRAGDSLARPVAQDLGRYARSITGALGHLESANGSYLTAFAAKDNLRQAVYEIPGVGTSGPYGVPNSGNAVQGTEIVERIVRDRFQPSVILSVAPMSVVADYTFEPFSGRILFSQPIPSVDAQLNPVSVRISYEVNQGTEKFWLLGAQGAAALSSALTVGGSIVREENPFAPYRLASANSTLQLGPRTFVTLEAAQSRSVFAIGNGGYLSALPAGPLKEVTGNGYRVEVVSDTDALKTRLYAARTDPNFNNPSTSMTGGRQELALQLVAPITPKLSGIVRASLSTDATVQSRRQSEEVGLAYKWAEQWRFEATLKHMQDNGGATLGINGGADGVASLAPLWNPGMYGGGLTGNNGVTSSQGTVGTAASGGWPNGVIPQLPVAYTGVQVTATYRATERLELTGQVLQDVQVGNHHSFSAGGKYQINDETKAYGRYEWSDGLSSVSTLAGGGSASTDHSGAAVFGLESEYMKNASAFSEYRLNNAMSTRDLQWANGLRNTWRLSDTVRVNTSAEHLAVLSGAGQSANAVTGAIEWAPTPLWLVAARLELRHTYSGAASTINTFVNNAIVSTPATALPGYDSLLDTLTVFRQVNQNWTALARDYGLMSRRTDGLGMANENRLQGGMAYRDSVNNRSNALFKYEHWTRRDSGSVLSASAAAPDADTLEGFTKDIVSVLGDWHPSRAWWATGRVAAKHEVDIYPASPGSSGRSSWGAMLLSGRLVYDITNRIDIGVMASVLRGISASDQGRQWANGVEGGYQLQDNVWISAGFNWRGFSAADMTGADYTQRGIFLRLRMKFDEDLFAARKFSTNRSISTAASEVRP